MKKKLIIIAITILLLISILGSGSLNLKTQKEEPYKERFLFIAPKEWNRIGRGIKRADREFYTNTKMMTFLKKDEEKQIEAIYYGVDADVDGIITGGMQPSEELEKAILYAKNQDIPIVFVDSDLPDSGRDCYIGSDNYEIGCLAGESMIEATKGEANICVLLGIKKDSNQKERLKGFVNTIQAYTKMKIVSEVEGESNKLVLKQKLPKTLEKEEKIDTLLCLEGNSTHYVKEILETDGRKTEDYTIIGTDYLNAVKNFLIEGSCYSTIWQDQDQMGYQAVKYLKDRLDGIERTENIIHTEIRLIDKENIFELKEQSQEELEWYVY